MRYGVVGSGVGTGWERGGNGVGTGLSSQRHGGARRATENFNGNFFGVLRAPRNYQRGEMSLTLGFVVLCGPPCSSVSL